MPREIALCAAEVEHSYLADVAAGAHQRPTVRLIDAIVVRARLHENSDTRSVAFHAGRVRGW